MNQEYKTPDFSQGSIKSNEEVLQDAINRMDSEIKKLEARIRDGDNSAYEDIRIKQKNRQVLAERLRDLQNSK